MIYYNNLCFKRKWSKNNTSFSVQHKTDCLTNMSIKLLTKLIWHQVTTPMQEMTLVCITNRKVLKDRLMQRIYLLVRVLIDGLLVLVWSLKILILNGLYNLGLELIMKEAWESTIYRGLVWWAKIVYLEPQRNALQGRRCSRHPGQEVIRIRIYWRRSLSRQHSRLNLEFLSLLQFLRVVQPEGLNKKSNRI